MEISNRTYAFTLGIPYNFSPYTQENVFVCVPKHIKLHNEQEGLSTNEM